LFCQKINVGFILGKDFSVISNSGILINKYAKAALKEGTSASDWKSFERTVG